MSVEIIESLTRTCPNLFFLFLSRPLEENQHSPVQSLVKVPQLCRMNLTGLQESDMEELITFTFSDMGVSSVDSGLLHCE
jgi:hypothetical protein